MSDVFELQSARSIEAEQAIEKAKELQRSLEVSSSEVEKVSSQLKKLLAVDDEFWPLWKYFAKQKGVKL